MRSSWLSAYFAFVIRREKVVFAIVAVVTVAAAAMISQGVIASSIGKMFFGDLPEYVRYTERIRAFQNDEQFVVGYDDLDLLGSDSQARLRKAVDAIESMQDVEEARTVLAAQRMRATDGDLIVEPYVDVATTSKAHALSELVADRFASGLLVSKDGGHATVLVELAVDEERTAERAPLLVQEVVDAMVAAGFDGELRLAGFPAILAEVMAESGRNFVVLLPMVAVVLFVLVLLILHRLGPALVCLSVAGIAGVWTLGFSTLLDREINLFATFVPTIVLIVTFSDIIHLWSAFRSELASGKAQQDAVMAAAEDVGRACLFTSVTTAIGFLSMVAVPTPMFQQFGVVLGFGVGVALILAMTLVPIVLSKAKTEAAPGPDDRPRLGTRLVDAALRFASSVTSQHPWLVILAFAAGAGTAVWGASHAYIDTIFQARFADDHKVRRDERWFAKHFDGTNGVDLFITADEDGGALDPELLRRVGEAQAALDADVEISKTLSLVDLLEEIHQQMTGQPGLPQTPEAVAQYLLLFEASGGDDISALIDDERRTLRLSFRIHEQGVRGTRRIGLESQEVAQALIGSRATVEATGMTLLLGRFLDVLFGGQTLGLSVSFCVISLLMIFALRSFRIGLLSMIPNALPLLALVGYIGIVWGRSDSDVFSIGMMAMGIGVDDTIHFLMRHRVESERTDDPAEALRRTFEFSGRAIVMTTAILAIGFAPFALGQYLLTDMIGTLLPGVLVVALLADVMLVPAMVQVGWLARH